MNSIQKIGLIGLVLAVFLFLDIPYVFASDVTFSCSDPPDRLARLAIAEGPLVNRTQDRNEEKCTFSVNGAKADSPDAAAIFQGVNSFRDGAPIIGQLREGSIDNLAYVMLATAPVSEIPNEFRNFLEENADRLADCMYRFFQGSEPNYTLSRNMGVSGYCRPYEARQYLDIMITWGPGERFITNLYIHHRTPNWRPMSPR